MKHLLELRVTTAPCLSPHILTLLLEQWQPPIGLSECNQHEGKSHTFSKEIIISVKGLAPARLASLELSMESKNKIRAFFWSNIICGR